MTLSIKSIGGVGNEIPTVTNLKVIKYSQTTIDIEYKVEDVELTICRHYLYLNGSKKEITKAVGYESSNNIFKYQITGLTRNTPYTIQIGASDGHDEGLSKAIQQNTQNIALIGVRVMENNSNPNSSVTYIEQAVGTNPANSRSLGGWENKWPFNKIRIVGFKNGRVTKEIKKDNKKQYVDGSTVPTDVDVMVEIPKIYWDFKDISNGYELRISDEKFNSTCACLAHKVSGVEKNNIYVGAYLGSFDSSRHLRSVSEASPKVSTTITNFRNRAHDNGDGYQQFNFYTLTLIQILYLIAFKNLDSQSALGKGYTARSNTSTKITGGTNTKGFVYGESYGDEQMCFLGIEDLWGNVFQFVDGIFYSNMHSFLVNQDNKSFNDNRDGYVGVASGYGLAGYINKVSHNNDSGFIPEKTEGSINTYYCDYASENDESFGVFGGNWKDTVASGVWSIRFFGTSTDSTTTKGGRLCYLG